MIEEDRGRAAVEAGPLVYCLEYLDAPEAESLQDLMLPANPKFEKTELTIDGRTVPGYETTLLCRDVPAEKRESLYRTLDAAPLRTVKARLIPYYAWDNRGRGEMLIWMPLAWREV